MTLLTRLFALVILTLLPMIAIEVYDEIDARAMRAEEGKDQALRLVHLVANQQSKVVEGARQLLTALAKMPAVRSGDTAECSAFFAELAQTYPQYISLISTDRSGRTICAGGAADPAANLADRPYVRLAIESGGFVPGEYDTDNPFHRQAVHLALPYYDSAGHVAGIVAAGLGLDWLNTELASSPLPPKATISVIDRGGTILARFPGREQFVGTKIASGAHSYLLSGGEGVQEALGFDGVSRIYAYAPVPGSPRGLTTSIGLDKGELLKGAEAANRRDIVVIAGSTVLALALAAFGARVFISRPIHLLLQAADHWRGGNLNARVVFSEQRSEIGRLAVGFNAMAAAIELREQELEDRVRQRTAALQEAMHAQQAAEVALYEAQKIETVGRLTGGIAHDFNNILAAIVGNLDLARARIGPGHPAAVRLDGALNSAHRGANLIQQLLAFARRQNLHPEVVDLNRYLEMSRDMLQRLLRSDVTVDIGLSCDTCRVRVDPNQLEAAILNLAVNARDAMPSGGTLRLQTRRVHFDPVMNQDGLGGDFVAITVSDTGTGIAPDVLAKVFEPFFTTKDVGAGSGLGLSMVQGFARQSSGSVRIDSTIGQGTAVTLYLPSTSETPMTINATAETPVAGQGTILLVDDDAEVREVTEDLLVLSGYTVISAADGNEAMACFRRDGRSIDILVTDLVLPDGMNGLELAAAVAAKRPDLPILLITGYSEALLDESQTKGLVVLTKPFGHAALARAVRQAMRGKHPDAAELLLAQAFAMAK